MLAAGRRCRGVCCKLALDIIMRCSSNHVSQTRVRLLLCPCVSASEPPPLPLPSAVRSVSVATQTPPEALAECCVCLADVAARAQLLAVLPCRHRCVCAGCAAWLLGAAAPQQRKCPKCRAPIAGMLRVFDE